MTDTPKRYRLLRVLEYVGTREWIEDAIRQRGVKGSVPRNWGRMDGTIREALVGDVIEEVPVIVVQAAPEIEKPPILPDDIHSVLRQPVNTVLHPS